MTRGIDAGLWGFTFAARRSLAGDLSVLSQDQ
jgi:hypothetical protein